MRLSVPLQRLLLLLCLTSAAPSWADVRLPAIVSDGMILQRDQPLKVWGWADPGEPVSVAFRKQQLSTTTGADGKWMVTLAPLTPGGQDTMEIKGRNEIVLRDILVGDVWVASGQSNMTHTFVRWQEQYAEVIAKAGEVIDIRQFHVPTNAVLAGPLDDIPNLRWMRATPETILDFTVVGYTFAQQILAHQKVPQGIIMTCVGGTPIEAWTSEAGFKHFPDQLPIIERNKDAAAVARINDEAAADRATAPARGEADRGMLAALKWFDPAYEPLNWKPIDVPGFWEYQGIRDLDGIVWFRKEIELPAAVAGHEAKIKLGRIRDADECYVNGTLVGRTTYQYPQREYTIPAGVLRAGSNLIVVRITNQGDTGGFFPDKPYQLNVADQSIDLKGTWHYKVGEAFVPAPRRYLSGINAQNEPAALFNGMVAPYVNYGIRGVLWYQGETNASNPAAYRALLPNFIADWRARWNQPELPFLIAQLPNYMAVDYLPAESNWALMREVQLETAMADANVGVGINIDLGEWNDIHPGGKMAVGERLALQALEIVYGATDRVSSGPIFRGQSIEGNKIRLRFDHVGTGLQITNNEPLSHFAIAGQDEKFVWADARIESNDTVIVWSDEIPSPAFVRYAWADNPDFANLRNSAGLPAAPFRTDR